MTELIFETRKIGQLSEVVSLGGSTVYSVLVRMYSANHIIYRYYKDKDKDNDSFTGPQKFVVGYSKAPEQPQSSARPICHFHTMTSTGANQPPYALLHRSSPCYALRHGLIVIAFIMAWFQILL